MTTTISHPRKSRASVSSSISAPRFPTRRTRARATPVIDTLSRSTHLQSSSPFRSQRQCLLYRLFSRHSSRIDRPKKRGRGGGSKRKEGRKKKYSKNTGTQCHTALMVGVGLARGLPRRSSGAWRGPSFFGGFRWRSAAWIEFPSWRATRDA